MDLFKDILHLVLSKKKFSQKVFYMGQAIIFTPFLICGTRHQKQGRNLSRANQAGDDVYPLF